MLKIIDEKLGLGSCNITDLTMQQVREFLGGWNDGAAIGTLTLFYDVSRNMVVLNQDNRDYEFFLEIVPRFMKLDAESREKIQDNAPTSLKETFKVLNSALERMEYRNDLLRLKHENVSCKYFDGINYIRRSEKETYRAFIYVFLYGMMCGKREDRARRKRAKTVER